jgi:hypothetical protein
MVFIREYRKKINNEIKKTNEKDESKNIMASLLD